MSACGNEAVVNGKALLGFKGVGGLSLATSLGAACLAVSMLQAEHSATERVLMAVVIIPARDANGVAGTAVGNLIFASSASGLTAIVALLSWSGAANLLENLAVAIRRCDGDDLIVWARLVT